MYKEFYGFTTYPFSLTPDPQFLYRSKNHENSLRYLSYSLERSHGLIVLKGKIGTGKTLLLNILVKSLDEKAHIAFLVNSKLDFLDILRHICREFGLESTGKSKADLLIDLENFLLMCEKTNEKAVVIIDEAQNLSVDTLEELRLLTNFENHERKLLQIILAGQLQLEYILKLPELAQLSQRIAYDWQLLPMNYYETKAYVEKRLAIAGCTYPLFTSRAMKKIFAASKGIPRVINIICDTALLFAFSDEKRQIEHTVIQRVVKGLNLYTPEKPLSYYADQKRGEHGSHASGISSYRDATPSAFSGSSRGSEGVERVEQHQRPRNSGRPRRLALIAGLTSLSLLGAGLILQSSLTGGKRRESTANPVLISLPTVLPPPMRELPFLPQSPGVHELPYRVQWERTTVSYQVLPGKPLTVSLPRLQRTPEDLPVKVTLDVSDSKPRWLTFDPEKLVLSGTAPPQETGKTYLLRFRARTADGLEIPLQLVLAVKGHTRQRKG
jgi:general secretion pathway protein A